MVGVDRPQVTPEEQRELAETLGVSDVLVEESSIDELREEVTPSTTGDFALPRKAIRQELEGQLDADLLAEELSALADRIQRIPEVRATGIPDGEKEPEHLYRELAEPGWRVYDHLLDVGFFEGVDWNMPRFTPEVISDTARELIRSDPLTAELADAGFDEAELTAMASDVTNNDRQLSRWVPASDIPAGVEFDVDHVPPLHQRAMGGSLLWIKNLDVHLWQKQVLVTDGILDDAAWEVKAMLGGLYLLTRAALEIAGDNDETLTDDQFTAALTASAAIMIVNQEAVCQDAYRITEEMRASSNAR